MRAFTAVLSLLSCAASLPLVAQNSARPVAVAANEKEPTVEERVAEARALPLFATTTPIEFTLTANFGVILRDRDSTSTTRYPGTVSLIMPDGAKRDIPVELRTRGHFRLMRRNCEFVPLSVNFRPRDVVGTVFEGQRGRIKLVTHCRNDQRYQQIQLREYLAYRLHNALSEGSYRARLARVSYVDSAGGKSLGTHGAFFIEHDDHMAQRNRGRIAEDQKGAVFDDLDPRALTEFAVFEYFIGNTDWSIATLHNVRLVIDDSLRYLPIPYDFDHSGLVNAHYATPDPRLSLRSVRDRLYRGPCVPLEGFEAVLGRYRERQNALLALIDSLPGMREDAKRDARQYLQEFFRSVRDARSTRATFVDGCFNRPGAN